MDVGSDWRLPGPGGTAGSTGARAPTPGSALGSVAQLDEMLMCSVSIAQVPYIRVQVPATRYRITYTCMCRFITL